MAQRLVSLWNTAQADHRSPMLDDAGFDSKAVDAKIAEMKAAVGLAGIRFRNLIPSSTANDPKWIFVGPEYIFAAQSIAKTVYTRIIREALKLSNANNLPLLIPGTAMVVNEDGIDVYNRSFACFDGRVIASYAKCNGAMEPVRANEVFKSGDGKSVFTLGGTKFGLQICRDSTPGMVPLANDTRIQIVQGRGVGFKRGGTAGSVEYARNYLIIAENGDYGVKTTGSETTGFLAPDYTEGVNFTTLHHYLVDF